jgi:hypothetical protein
VAARFGNGIQMVNPTEGPGDRLAYSSEGKIDSDQGTIEFWVKPSGYEDGYLFDVSSYALSNSNISEMEMEKTPSFLVFRIYDNAGTVHSLTDEDGLHAGQWHFIAVTWNNINSPSSAELNLYVDGKMKETLDSIISLTFAERNIHGEGTDIGIGYSLENPFEVLRAESIIDQFRILNYTKTEAELLNDYSSNRTYTIDFYTEDNSVNCNCIPSAGCENCKKNYTAFSRLNVSYAWSDIE